MARRRFATVDVDAFRRHPTEAEMAASIEQIVKLKGGYYWHVEDSRNCPEMVNFWDTTIVLPPLLVCVELKSQRRPFESAGQEAVAAMLAECRRMVTGVVRPDPLPGEYSYGELLDALKGV